MAEVSENEQSVKPWKQLLFWFLTFKNDGVTKCFEL